MSDTERLDWLLDHEAVVHMGPNGGHWVGFEGYEQAEYYVDERAAIDAAMRETLKETEGAR